MQPHSSQTLLLPRLLETEMWLWFDNEMNKIGLGDAHAWELGPTDFFHSWDLIFSGATQPQYILFMNS